MYKKRQSLVGRKFGKLQVLRDSGKRYRRNVIYTVLCDCGNLKEIRGSCLSSGGQKTCGCNTPDQPKKKTWAVRLGRQLKRRLKRPLKLIRCIAKCVKNF